MILIRKSELTLLGLPGPNPAAEVLDFLAVSLNLPLLAATGSMNLQLWATSSATAMSVPFLRLLQKDGER
jgi:hypothetical protein